MAEKPTTEKRPISADWFVHGVLSKLGDAVDRLLGRGWKSSSSLATSELIERLKKLVDKESRADESGRTYVPHNIKLKMQWDKFSADSGDALSKLKTELLTALVDHINDRRYHTKAPISLEVKQDYFTSGVKLLASFDTPDENEASLDVTLPDVKVEIPASAPAAPIKHEVTLEISYKAGGGERTRTFTLGSGSRLSIGRTKENDVALDDASVSKIHAALLLDNEGSIVLSDTGSTNGTFVDGERIAYGKAVKLLPGQPLRFGAVDVLLTVTARGVVEELAEAEPDAAPADPSSYKVGEFEFKTKAERLPAADASPSGLQPQPTLPSLEAALPDDLPAEGAARTAAEPVPSKKV